ncbi:FAD-binding oxidoreductase [Paucibacter sp. KBW04]|uniref:FAD-binding oxidoreductase n=1 Tax=Paucibacter sp. KBW04 TaxID=2153361 RepID=UPI0018CC26E4|nr:FAD-binding oxidoreductase [Paucibacter sp. KBW04]
MPTASLIHLANGRQFPAIAGKSLLDCAAQAGLVLEHSCRNGRCGTCKTRVLQGQTEPLLPDQSLSPEQQAEGWVLSCAVQALGEVSLDAEDLGPLAELKLLTLPARIDSLEQPTPDVLRLVLRLPPNSGFRYLAGQYINIIGPQGIKRAYSLANAPRADGKLQLHIKKVAGGALSTYWFEQAKVGDLLRLEGPRGSFFLRDVAGMDLFLLATGTGFAPILALLEELAQRPAEAQPRSLAVYWGGRQAQDLYSDLPALPPHCPPLNFVPVLSRADESWGGERGHIQDALLRRNPSLTNAWVFACGSNAMIASAQKQLLAAGLSARRFCSDAFVAA